MCPQGDPKEEIAHFVQATIKKNPYIVSAENAIASIAVIEAALSP